MTWLIKTSEKGKEPKLLLDGNAKNFKKFLEANSKSHFDFNKIMDDSSVGSLFNANNEPSVQPTAAILLDPGINLGKQANSSSARISNNNDSISDISSKGSTVKSIFHRIKSNKQ